MSGLSGHARRTQYDKGVACNVKEGVHTFPENLHIELNGTVSKIDVKLTLNQAPAPAMYPAQLLATLGGER